MTKAELIDRVAEATGMKKKDAASTVEAVFNAMVSTLKKHEKVQISGFGTFEARRRKARLGRDPRTQETIKVPASWSLGFRPAKQLKGLVSGKVASSRSKRR